MCCVQPDVLGLKELAMYGLKGTCAYAEHASVLGKEDPAIFQTVHEILDDVCAAHPPSPFPALLLFVLTFVVCADCQRD
jgi:hypothetical protein